MTDDERDPDYEPAPFLVRERLRGTVAEVAACFERFATEYHAQFAFVPGERRLIEHSEHKATLLIRSGRHYDGSNGHMFPDPYLYVTVRGTPTGALLETEMTTPGYDVSGNLTLIFEELRAQLVAEGFIGDETRQPAQAGAGDGQQVISIPEERAAKIRKMAVEDGLSDIQIARKLTISASRVKQIRLDHGIKRRTRKKSLS